MNMIMKKINYFIMAILVSAFCLEASAQVKNTKDLNMKEKTLVVYFSRTGENYAVGNIDKGNTEIIAEMIAEKTGGTLFQIVPEKAYPDNYKECIDLAKRELNSNARPDIKGDVDVEEYDTIFIGYPNWWGDVPMPLYTFIEKHNWHGKTVIPFCTHEGSGLGSTPKELAVSCKGATFQKGLAVCGATAQNSRDEARKAVNDWLEALQAHNL